MYQVGKFLSNSFKSEIDPIKEWDDSLKKKFVLSKSFAQNYDPEDQEMVRRRRGMLLIAFFELFKTVHYFCMLFVPLDSSQRLRAFTGSIYHCMGFGGKVLAIPSFTICFQTAITRLLYLRREPNDDLKFLKDFANFRSSSLLSNQRKEKLAKRLHYFHFLAKWMFILTSPVCHSITIIFGIYSIYMEPDILMGFWWTFWTLNQDIGVYIVVWDIRVASGMSAGPMSRW